MWRLETSHNGRILSAKYLPLGLSLTMDEDVGSATRNDASEGSRWSVWPSGADVGKECSPLSTRRRRARTEQRLRNAGSTRVRNSYMQPYLNASFRPPSSALDTVLLPCIAMAFRWT